MAIFMLFSVTHIFVSRNANSYHEMIPKYILCDSPISFFPFHCIYISVLFIFLMLGPISFMSLCRLQLPNSEPMIIYSAEMPGPMSMFMYIVYYLQQL